MPRSTAKSKAKNGNKVKSCNASKNTTKVPKNCVLKKEKIIKNELGDTAKETVIEEVFHRKSERRRVARDIFLVFEEQSNPRRKTRGVTKKQTKPKFAHLKVEDPIRPKGLLRDIKNEPKCYLNGSSFSVNSKLPTDVLSFKIKSNQLCASKEEKKVKSEKIKTAIHKTGNSTKSNSIKSIKKTQCTLENDSALVARVNPIFLWVKQDDTRIVEVRCEDYDKRNRIRITKTSNGWRAIPRSDPTSSRVLKFYPTPLMKVKRENNIPQTDYISSKIDNKDNMVCKEFTSEVVANNVDIKLNRSETVFNPLIFENVKSKTKKSKKIKKKSRSDKATKKSEINVTAIQNLIRSTKPSTALLNPLFKSNPLEEPDILIKTNKIQSESKVDHEIMHKKDLLKDISVHNINGNSEGLETYSNPTNLSLSVHIPLETESTYQRELEEELAFHLCPKTGLFLSNNSISEYENQSFENENDQNTSKVVKTNFLNPGKEEFNSDIAKINTESKIQISEENTESLEAKTKNLKDLLDDADLLQNCDENANCDADLIDTLVKTSCENNLIQANEIITKSSMDQILSKTLHGSNEMVVQLISDVSDPPKCLSFNEAGEIEGLNGDLFQSNNFMESFDKVDSDILTESQVMLHSTTSVVETTTSHKTPLQLDIEPNMGIDIGNSKLRSDSVIDDSPKDLSYKKREEVCPPSESRSQCAVTSSSDVIKSPLQEETSSLTASSETLKNLILEQFIKLNALTTKHQREPIDLEKQRNSDISNLKSLYSSKSLQSNDFIETVVIDDDDDSDCEHDEPLKKRLRLNKHKVLSQNVGKLTMIDKDPDPLTQLRLLIRNTQWKVPDPILVPKDRLSAVLASPAREIPLLITTRPELRLPEAFAYPEIIQNPNILVISMAQLEAILENDLKDKKTSCFQEKEKDVTNPLSNEQADVQLTNRFKDIQSHSPIQHHLQHTSKQIKTCLSSSSKIQGSTNITTDHMDMYNSSEKRKEYTNDDQTDSSLSSDFNSATMAMLNQMLWLPYFGQISQDIAKSLQNPISLQEKCSNIVPFFNSYLNSATNLEDIINISKNKKITGQSASNTGIQHFQQQVKSNEELSLFQKIVQHQMQSVLQLNQLKTDSSQLLNAVVAENSGSSLDKANSKIEGLPNLIEHRKQKINLPNKQTNTFICRNQTNNCSSSISVPEKSYNLRSSVAGRHSAETTQYSNNIQRQVAENKPRLTCKSLSNLLDPEHSVNPSNSSSIPYVKNLSSDYAKNVNEIQKNSADFQISERNADGKGTILGNATIAPPSPRTCSITNIGIESSSELSKQKTKTYADSIPSENNPTNNEALGLTTDTNIPLWHPLFGR